MKHTYEYFNICLVKRKRILLLVDNTEVVVTYKTLEVLI